MAEDKPLKKPFTDEQKDLLMDYLFNKFIEDMRKDEMRREDFYNQPPKTDPEGKPILSANMGGMVSPVMMSGGGTPPKIGTSIVSVGEVFDAIKDPEGYVRPTTKLDNLQRALDRGTDSTVTRSMGYENLFETFQKKGIDKVTINKFKNIPDITDFLGKDGTLTDTNINKYNKALKKFRLDAFKGLNAKQLSTIESSGFLSQFAKDQRNKILKSGGKFNQKNLNKVIDQMFDFTFKDLDTAVGVKDPKIQDKKITKAMDKVNANKNIKPDQKLNIKYGLSQVDKLIKLGNTPAAKKLLTVILTIAPKGLFGMDLLIPTKMGSGELPKEGTPEYEQLMKDMGKNQGGMMDINFMTRPLGYKDGTREGTTVGDLEKNVKGIPSDADVKVVTDLLAKPTETGSMTSLKNMINTMNEVRGVLSDEDVLAVKKSLPFPGLREFAASEVMRAAGDQKRVDTIQLASDYLRSIGMSGNEAAMNNVINILNNQIVPEEELKIMKEGESSLEKGMQGIGRGIEGLLQFLKLQEEGTGKFQTLDDRTLQKLIEMRAQ